MLYMYVCYHMANYNMAWQISNYRYLDSLLFLSEI